MTWIKILKKSMLILILGSLLPQMLGCGAILYPERRGQRGGQLDVGVAVLDGIGLFFFIVPGVIAFAVDFGTGTIYLPHGRTALYPEEIKAVRVNPEELSKERISEIVAQETGIPAALDSNKTQVIALNKTEDILAKFADLKNAVYRAK